MHKTRILRRRSEHPEMVAGGGILTLGIACCAGAIVLVLAVAFAAI